MTEFEDKRLTFLSRDYRVALLLAGLACVMRPTNGLIWLFLGVQLIIGSSGRRVAVIFNAAVIV